MVTFTHQMRRHPEVGETTREGSRVDRSAHARQDERGNAGSRQARGGRGKARREVGWRYVWLLVTVVLVSTSGARAFGANLPRPADPVCSLIQLTNTISVSGLIRPSIDGPAI